MTFDWKPWSASLFHRFFLVGFFGAGAFYRLASLLHHTAAASSPEASRWRSGARRANSPQLAEPHLVETLRVVPIMSLLQVLSLIAESNWKPWVTGRQK